MACFKKIRLDLSEGLFYNFLFTNADLKKKMAQNRGKRFFQNSLSPIQKIHEAPSTSKSLFLVRTVLRSGWQMNKSSRVA